MSAPDAQLQATAKLLLPRLALAQGNRGLQRILDRYAPLLYDRGQFAVVCWSSPETRALVPACVHASDDEVVRLALHASQFDVGDGPPVHASVTLPGYSVPLIVTSSMRKVKVTAVLDLYQVVS